LVELPEVLAAPLRVPP